MNYNAGQTNIVIVTICHRMIMKVRMKKTETL